MNDNIFIVILFINIIKILKMKKKAIADRAMFVKEVLMGELRSVAVPVALFDRLLGWEVQKHMHERMNFDVKEEYRKILWRYRRVYVLTQHFYEKNV
ncbi:MAG: hypothetical protein IJ312_07870 [Treponema sp.]|nr:hypothetical protein [Treponema sp.]